MRQTLFAMMAVLALVGCKEEDGDDSDAAQENTQTAPAENAATADDGGGALDGATSEDNPTAPNDSMDSPAMASEVSQEAIDGCIDAVMAADGAMGGQVISTEFSEANSEVVLEDGAGTTWRCLVSSDGSDASVERMSGEANADDGEGAMDGAAADTDAAQAGNATDVTAFEGARAGQAEGGLINLGFESIRSEGLTTFWFNRETGACAKITTNDGVYSEVVMLPAGDC